MRNYEEHINMIAMIEGKTAEQVRRDIQFVIDDAFNKGNIEMLSIPRKGEIPTVEEFLDYKIDRAIETK